jgi:hypothetical protein
MAFSVSWLRQSRFTSDYNWPVREVRPTPEFVVFRMIQRDMLLLDDLKGLRADKNQLSADNIVQLDLDWVTHCHSDIWVYDRFVAHNLPRATISATIAAIGPNSEHPKNPPCSLPAKAPTVAVVVGGALCVWDEIKLTKALLAEAGEEPLWLVINDMIPLFYDPCIAISLHPDKKLGEWLTARAEAGHPAPTQVWSNLAINEVTHLLDDWRGSSGLFAVAVALKLGFTKIVLAGVPMQASAGHIVRGVTPWKAVEQFMGGWKGREQELRPFVRSWSGWTGKAFGRPSLAFLEGERVAAE